MKALEKLVQKPISGEWGKEGNKVKVLRTTNFTNQGVIDYGDVVTRDISEKKIEQKKLINGDVIIEKSGGSPTQPVGRVVYFDCDEIFLCNNFTSILRPKKEIVFPKYLHYLLFANHCFGVVNYFQNKTTGIINLQLNRYLKEAKIPLPPLAVQEKIASILDDAAALRDKTEQLLTEYDLLAQSIFLEMFGDPVTTAHFEKEKLEDLFDISSSRRIYKREYVSEGIPFYRTKEIVELSKGEDISLELFISDARYNEVKEKYGIPKIGDILISAVGTIGVMWVIDTNAPFYFKDGNLLWLKTSELKKLNRFYLISVLNRMISHYKSNLAQGAAYNALTIIRLKNFEIPVPPLNLQNQFAEKIQLIERQKEIVRQELKESEDLFQALLQKAFKGELV